MVSIRLLAFLLSLATAWTAPPESLPKVPPEFLQTTHAGWQKILAKEIAINFRNASLREAFDFLVTRGVDANLVLDVQNAKPVSITRRVEKVPFRTALYLLARDAGATVEWELTASGAQRSIRIILK